MLTPSVSKAGDRKQALATLCTGRQSSYLEEPSLLFKIFVFIRFCIRQVIDLDIMFFNFIQNLKE